MRVLVTGGTGFVGRHLLSLLASRGHESFFTTTRETSSDPGCLTLRIPDEGRCLEVLEATRPQAIIHLAGMAFVPEAERNPVRASEVNVEGTLGLLKSLDKLDPAGSVRFIHVSTCQVYDPRQGGCLKEKAFLGPPNAYARTKLASELLAEIHVQTSGRTGVIFRPFNHVGPGQRESFVVSSFARQVALLEGESSLARQGDVEPLLEVGDLDVSRDFCDVRDIVKAYSLAAEGALPSGTYNLASGIATPLSAVVDIFHRLSRRPFGVKVVERLLRAGDIPSLTGDPGKIHAVCGWRAEIPLEDSILDTLEWWRRRKDA